MYTPIPKKLSVSVWCAYYTDQKLRIPISIRISDTLNLWYPYHAYPYFSKHLTYYLADKYVFVEEAKLLVNHLKEMKNHPIVPSAKIHKIELDADIAAYNALLHREQEIDNRTASLAPNGTEIEEANARCEENAIHDDHCPAYGEWAEWTVCAGCGEGALRGRVRSGCTANGTTVGLDVCELDSKIPSQEKDDCVEPAAECENENDKYNNGNSLVVEILRSQIDAAKQDSQYNKEMVNQMMMTMQNSAQQNSQAQMQMMANFQKQSMEFQARD